MYNEDEEALWAVLTILGLGIIVGILLAMSSCSKTQGEQAMQKEAVVQGVAYYTNDSLGQSKWQWKTVPIVTITNHLTITNEIIKLEKGDQEK